MPPSAPPPDLRVLCRKLTSIPPAQLPHALPALTRHVVRCKDALAAAPHEQQQQQQKSKDDAASAQSAAALVHKLKASITTLLNGRSREARFAAVGLVKAVVDVGGWEMLRASEPWARGLLSIIQVRRDTTSEPPSVPPHADPDSRHQKGDSFAAKELAVVVLTRIFALVHPYQTLVREIATPNIPAFVTACLQLVKPPAAGSASTAPLAFVETVYDAFSTLIPLYATTFRPFGSQIRSAVRPSLAPTSSDEVLVPHSLQRSAGRLAISLHHVAAKSGGSEEWSKTVDAVLRQLHATADQVLRAVDESWEATGGYGKTTVDFADEPKGGSTSTDQLPPWTGLDAGVERLVGLFRHLSDCLLCATKGAVTIPLSALLDAISRVCLITRQSPRSQTWDQALETNAAVGREEKEELWSLMPEIHVAALGLIQTMLRRLGRGMLPLVSEAMDHLVRVFKSGMDVPDVRRNGYVVLDGLLTLSGQTLSKPTVAMLEPLIAACCRDLQQDAGFLKPASKPVPQSKDSKKAGVANVDLFLLQPQASAAAEDVSVLDPDHKAAADSLLPTLLSALPQQHLKPTLRGLLDKTAILTQSRDAMLASVLNPFKDQRGRMYPSILPHLARAYPHDQGLEVLRSNLRMGAAAGGSDMLASVNEVEEYEDEDDADADEDMADAEVGEAKEPEQSSENGLHKSSLLPSAPQVEIDLPVQSNPFAPGVEGPSRAESPPKRKHEGADSNPPKRQEVEKATPAAEPARAAPSPQAQPADEADRDDDDSDVSVHLNMELEDDEDDEDEAAE
ncbi:short-chain dehydrogenase [Purpureocillium lavendulum]|uniref:Pre-rRNA-processing protein RIX1 n=1 Tax=Purpureocillium lavendulum TaxID=1247861 RepID=A0AB34G5G8_9HYPO|nr:short-chain dehydrogenase [Purpureocillium lavendulum]